MVANKVDFAAADQSTAVSGVAIKDELPKGDYILVAIDIDTTGRRLIDEIVQLAAYTPTDHFEQYIMPYMNLNPAARQRHQVRVISIGFFRMLKSMQTYKIIKSKSEVAALKDFLDWLDQLKLKNPNANGIVLLYHEERKFIPYMILQSLVKYGMLERFSKTVKSFVNSFKLAKSSMADTKHHSLRSLSKLLSRAKEDNALKPDSNCISSSSSNGAIKNRLQRDRGDFDGSASVRAKLAFNVALKLSNLMDSCVPESSDDSGNLFNALKPYTEAISSDVDELDTQNVHLERQNSFRPVFLHYFKTTLYHRVRAVKFRIVLAENGFDLTTFRDIWTDKHSEGLHAALQGIDSLKAEDKCELVGLLDSFFDPNKTTIKPIVKPGTIRRRHKRNSLKHKSGAGDEIGAGGDKSQSVSSVPDSTTKTPPSSLRNGSRPQRKRNSRASLNNNSEVKITESDSTGISVSGTQQQIPIAATN
ncbi:GH19889 [Drosophila grimshawi]|uniref:GH19889 n=1 Tax=Drosophila grimshawi TaxID=7222 RepID=B4J965_DROGR|nr:GH19889 [Drosophila grimshawi]